MTLLRSARAAVFAAMLPALCACLAACSSFGGDSAAAPAASTMRHPALVDFPVPSGFRLVDEHSRSRNYGAVRMVQFEYEGGTSAGSVARFYQEQLPASGWTLKHEAFFEGEYSMRFDSDKEECNLRVRRARTGGKTLVNVDIGPVARGSTERPPARQNPKQ